MKNKFILWCLMISGIGLAEGATVTLSMDEAVKRALQHSHAIKKQNVGRAKMQHAYREAKSAIYPQISLETALRHYLTTPQVMGFSLNRDYETAYGLTVSQAVYTFGAVSNALDAADAALKLQDHSRAVVEREVAFAARMSYLAVLVADKQVEIAEAALKTSRDNLRILEGQFNSGRPPQADLLRLNTDIAHKVPAVTIAKSEKTMAESRLKYLLGLDQKVSLKLTNSLHHDGHIALESSREKMESHPRLSLIRENINMQESLARLQKSSNLPSIAAFYSWNQNMQSNDRFFHSENLMKTSVVGLQISWSIWDGGGGNARYLKALSDKSEAEIDLAEAQEEIQAEVQIIGEELPALRENLLATRKALTLAEQSLEMSRRRFQSGKTSVLELNDSEYMLTQLRLSEALAMFKLHESEAKLKKIFASQQKKREGKS